ncbi:MAG: hypothetical protein HY507_00930 [Candidatus Zambryskibacteria bacterium]|nr:hypothetical protein [Candidatus Zambryskibacteria bacterium]
MAITRKRQQNQPSSQKTSSKKFRFGWVLGLLAVVLLALLSGRAIYNRMKPTGSSSVKTPLVVVKSGTVEVLAPPAPKWSDRVLTPGWTTFDSDEPVLVMLSQGKPVPFDPKDKKNLGQTDWLEFQSRTNVAVKVTVTKK